MMESAARQDYRIGAVVLAAGQSCRMGSPKLILPWGSRTVIEQVILTLTRAGVTEITVVTGAQRELIENVLKDYPVRLAHNGDYACSGMATTFQVGLETLASCCQAVMIVLGDQPTIEEAVVQQVIEMHLQSGKAITIPSYEMRRGHPWLVDRRLWPDLLRLTKEQTLRDFLQAHQDDIAYIQVDTPGILLDLDTPEDYNRLRPGN